MKDLLVRMNTANRGRRRATLEVTGRGCYLHAATRDSSLSLYPGFSSPRFRESSRWLALPRWPLLVLSVGRLVIGGMKGKKEMI
ncbi:unnamed protein product, partial [Hymenolepis diminuta]